jgi:hypothetical protein
MASDRELRGERVEPKGSKTEFEELGKERSLSLAREFLLFILENKAWWLIPIVASLGLLGLLIALGSTGAAPFIYPLF